MATIEASDPLAQPGTKSRHPVYMVHTPEVVGNEYLVLGKFDRSDWRRGRPTPYTIQTVLDNLHDFREVLRFEIRQGWLP